MVAIRKLVKCIELDEDKTLKIGEIYEVMYTYMNKEYLIVNEKGYEQFYKKELFIEVQVINIPKTNATNSKKKTKTNTANRGLDFEAIIEKKCEKLRNNNIALINKVPTEWKVLRKFNPSKKKTEIFNAFPVEESRFVDFIGIYNNLPIAMEAKSTKELTRFPFANIKESQINFLNLWIKLGGFGYYIIRFEEHKKIFMIEALKFHECMNTIGRKSAPYEWFLDENNAIELDYEDINFIEYINNKK